MTESAGAPPSSKAASERGDGPLTPYQRRLFVFLSVATFFEGYDFFAFTQVLPRVRAEFGLDPAATGLLAGVVNLGTLLAYVLVSRADRWGRKRVLGVTILGYALFTFFSGLAPNAWVFGLCQMIARVFLIGEWATSMVMAAEEYPARRRGMVIGVISAASGLGGVLCAGVVPTLTAHFGWRSVYFVGVLPLVFLAYVRRGLRETERFEAAKAKTEHSRSLFEILKGPHRRRVLELGAIWFLTYACTQNAVTFWKDHALTTLHLTDQAAGQVIAFAALSSMPLVFFAGKMADVIGRKRAAALTIVSLVIGVLVAYSATDFWVLALAMSLSVFGINAILTVLNAFTAELFPTALRGDAFAWANNLIGRVGYCVSPIIVGQFATDLGWAPVLRFSTIFPIVALVLVLWLLPETRARELEATAEIDGESVR
jgi:MFS transporter, putative metabolite:H+ symporter